MPRKFPHKIFLLVISLPAFLSKTFISELANMYREHLTICVISWSSEYLKGDVLVLFAEYISQNLMCTVLPLHSRTNVLIPSLMANHDTLKIPAYRNMHVTIDSVYAAIHACNGRNL